MGKFFALVIWILLLAQALLSINAKEPYPSFSLPSFGHSKSRITANTVSINTQTLLLVFESDTVNFTNTSFLKKLEPQIYNALCNKLRIRSVSNLNRKEKSSLTYIFYRYHFKVEPKIVEELKQWIIKKYCKVPKELLLKIDTQEYLLSNHSSIDSNYTQIISIEIF